MSEKRPDDDRFKDPNPHLKKPIIVDCSDWEPDIPADKWCYGQFISDPDLMAPFLPPFVDDEDEGDAKEGESAPPS